MSNTQPYALTIAGFDPSGGAGLVSDVKTFEANGVYGLSVCTSITIQNDIEFKKVNWLAVDEIIEQVDILLKRFEVKYFKIGLIKNLTDLDEILSYLKANVKDAFIVWDPILKASAGFEFHSGIDRKQLEEILSKIDLITPNIPEVKTLTGFDEAEKAAEVLSQHCSVYLKGGHSEEKNSKDVLLFNKQKYDFNSERILSGEKHGSGCVLSSAITANLAKGLNLYESCTEAKNYMTAFLSSNKTLLGTHNFNLAQVE